MVTYNIFVHPGFPAEKGIVRGSKVFRNYCDELSALAISADKVIHVIDPQKREHDAFLEKVINDDCRIRSYALNLPFFPSYYGTVCAEDWDTFVGLFRDIRQHRDPVRIHGSYHGVCALDFAIQLYELVYNHKQYLSDRFSCLLDAPFPFRSEDTEEIVQHALQAHYLNANIRFGTVFADPTFEKIHRVRKSIVRQMTDRETKVYSL